MEQVEAAKKPVKKKTTKKSQSPQRVFKGEQELVSDRFRLEDAIMLKNVGWDPKSPIFEQHEHHHYFRTYDSNGKRMTKCYAVGGHAHEVTVEEVDGEWKVEIGPARKEVRGRLGAEIPHDQHTHKVSYEESQKIIKRVRDERAAQDIARMTTIPKLDQ